MSDLKLQARRDFIWLANEQAFDTLGVNASQVSVPRESTVGPAAPPVLHAGHADVVRNVLEPAGERWVTHCSSFTHPEEEEECSALPVPLLPSDPIQHCALQGRRRRAMQRGSSVRRVRLTDQTIVAQLLAVAL